MPTENKIPEVTEEQRQAAVEAMNAYRLLFFHDRDPQQRDTQVEAMLDALIVRGWRPTQREA